MPNSHDNTLRDQVLESIKTGETKMKPKWHFFLRALLFILGIITMMLLLLYVVSFVLFLLQENGLWFVPIFGWNGIGLFLTSLPWLLISFVILFLIILQILVKHYSFSYHRPLFYSALFIVGVVLLGGVILVKSEFHEGFSEYAREHEIPFANPIYESFKQQSPPRIHPGLIVKMEPDDFFIKNRIGEVLEVELTGETRFPRGVNFFVGDKVIVVGVRHEQKILADGVMKIDNTAIKRPSPKKIYYFHEDLGEKESSESEKE